MDIHIARIPPDSPGRTSMYPVNFLRNIALTSARTKIALILDVDLVPFSQGGLRLLNAANRLMHDAKDAHKRVFVVPAFEQVCMILDITCTVCV